MKLYRLTIGKSIQGSRTHDWYSGQLEHMAKYGDANEAKAHLKDGNKDGAPEWPEVYDEAGNRMILQGRKLVKGSKGGIGDYDFTTGSAAIQQTEGDSAYEMASRWSLPRGRLSSQQGGRS